jgi:branched-chain amino acid transport system ATP-binding protein
MSLLEVRELRASYGPVTVLHGLDLSVEEGEVCVLLGANGAGKTTALRALSGMVHTSGSVRLAGAELVGMAPERIVALGMTHMPQGRGTFNELTVEENLEAGAFVRRDRGGVRADMAHWLDGFPLLAERRHEKAGNLSGGEQQMLAIARAMMARPRLLLLDEPSLGLAPIVTRDLFQRLTRLNKVEGMTMLVVEQNASLALSIAHRAYLLESGAIVLSGMADVLAGDDAVRIAYLGF